jgi:hypothetical protein
MKYLLLLVVPALLSSSPPDRQSDKTVKLTVYNYTDCNATVEYKACTDASCSRTSEGTFYANADAVGGVEYTSLDDGPYFCSIIIHLPDGKSDPLYLDSRCGSGSVTMNCDGDKVTGRKTDQSGNETRVAIED